MSDQKHFNSTLSLVELDALVLNLDYLAIAYSIQRPADQLI